MIQAVHAYFSGRVQGVGFRFTARQLAAELGIAGWVKNLSDGRVEVVAEADEAVLKDFLSRLERTFRLYIRDIQTDWQPASSAFDDFTVSF